MLSECLLNVRLQTFANKYGGEQEQGNLEAFVKNGPHAIPKSKN